jgi:hypothetical protein
MSANRQLARKVFLSHCSQQANFVDTLGHLLQLNAIEYFSSAQAERGCTQGLDFKQQLRQNVRDAQVVVFVLSKDFFGSKWCRIELAEALLDKDKVLLPVFHGWQEPQDLRAWLDTAQQQLEQEQLGAGSSCCCCFSSSSGTGSSSSSSLLAAYKGGKQLISNRQGIKQPADAREFGFAQSVVHAVRPHVFAGLFSEQFHVATTEWTAGAIERLEQSGKLGLWGMGGIGKTTLAQMIYNRVSCRTQFGGRTAFVQVRSRVVCIHKLLFQVRHYTADGLCISPPLLCR